MAIRNIKTLIIVTLLLLLATHIQALVEPGRIAVYSTPSGAVACIDTMYCDTTDAIFTVTGNTWHTITVTNKGYMPWTYDLFAVSSRTQRVDAALELNPAITVLQVDVTPGSGTVCLDNVLCHTGVGMFSGSGSTQFLGVSEGYHTITVRSPGTYEDYFTTVYVNFAKTTYLNINLKSLSTPSTPVAPIITPIGTPIASPTGMVRVYVDQTGSTICLDTTNCRQNVGGPVGPGTGTTLFTNVSVSTVHTISVTADGYRPYSTQVTVLEDMIKTVDVSLQSSILPVTTVTARFSSVQPTLLATPAGLGAIPVIGGLALCGAVFLSRNNRR